MYFRFLKVLQHLMITIIKSVNCNSYINCSRWKHQGDVSSAAVSYEPVTERLVDVSWELSGWCRNYKQDAGTLLRSVLHLGTSDVITSNVDSVYGRMPGRGREGGIGKGAKNSGSGGQVRSRDKKWRIYESPNGCDLANSEYIFLVHRDGDEALVMLNVYGKWPFPCWSPESHPTHLTPDCPQLL